MTDFCPALWREEPTPEPLLDCGDCGLITHGSRMIWGEGNPAAPIVVVLDNPGAREDREGNPYVCGTRQMLQQTIAHVGLSPDDVYVTYILKRRPVRAYDKERTRHICMKHLVEQLQTKRPDAIVCLGNVAVQSFFQDTEAEVKALRGQWHRVHGYPTAVSYHPLAVRRRPNLRALFIEDWKFVVGRQ